VDFMEFKTSTLKQKIIVIASPEELYEAFMNPEVHSAFTGDKATGVPEVGQKFTAGDGYISGKNLELVKGKKIVQEWKTSEWPSGYPPSIFKLTFKKTKSGTVVNMTHSKVPTEQAEYYRQGWIDYYWNPLKKCFDKKTKENSNSA
jgi:activator of HSP90 ATPase